MVGSRPTGPTFGASNERFARFILGTFAFVVPVPYEDDIGIDIHCVLHRRGNNGRMIRAGSTFGVQVKSSDDLRPYEKGDAATWLSSPEFPFFVCVVDRAQMSCELYSTWNTHNAHLLYGPLTTVLEPGLPISAIEDPKDGDGTLHVPLGPPVLRLTPGDVIEGKDAMAFADLLEPWIAFDRRIISRRGVEMYWTDGPETWETNQPIPPESSWKRRFFWNPKNLPSALDNFTRSAAAFRRILASHHDGGLSRLTPAQFQALDSVLREFSPALDPLALQIVADLIADAIPSSRTPDVADETSGPQRNRARKTR